MRKIALLFILVSTYTFSQGVNDYQYVIVPAKFEFFKNENQFRINTLTKLLLQKYGFKAYLSNEEIPAGIADQRCNLLYANVLNDSGMLVTSVKIVLKNCKEQIVFETEYGKSREKDLAVAFNEALRNTGKSFDKLNYKYNGKNGMEAETMGALDIEPTSAQIIKNSDVAYYAQSNANGFQVVDTTPKVVMLLLNTSQKNVFIASKGSINGVALNKNGQWFFEYYENGKLISEPLNLKF